MRDIQRGCLPFIFGLAKTWSPSAAYRISVRHDSSVASFRHRRSTAPGGEILQADVILAQDNRRKRPLIWLLSNRVRKGDIMAEATYIAEMKIERGPGAIRVAQLPAESAPVYFGVHGAIAKHYGLNPANIKEPRAATLDYVIAAAGA